MKLLLVVCVFVAGLSLACSTSEPLSNANKQTYKAVGVIKAIDSNNGKLTIDHEDIEGYMNAMVMDIAVKDNSLIATVKVGDKVEFELERSGEQLMIATIRKIGEIAIFDGDEIYRANCAACHGGAGEGTKKGIPLTTGHALHHSEDEHIRQVADGENDKMPAFKNKLKPEEIKAVVDYIRSSLQKGVNRDDSKKHPH